MEHKEESMGQGQTVEDNTGCQVELHLHGTMVKLLTIGVFISQGFRSGCTSLA
jgi:hypothetical protein